jgi:hypothetical protein
MTKMRACFQKLAQREIGQCHANSCFSGSSLTRE